jgi:hypothetical protein
MVGGMLKVKGDYVEVCTNNKVLAIRDFVTLEVLCAL